MTKSYCKSMLLILPLNAIFRNYGNFRHRFFRTIGNDGVSCRFPYTIYMTCCIELII